MELDAEEIMQLKVSWEAFVAEARKQEPKVVATLSAYGTKELIHSLQLVMQWPDQRIEYLRSFHLLDGDLDRLTDEVIEEVGAIGPKVKLAMLNEPLPVEHCPCCKRGLSRTLNPAVVTRLTDPRWANESLCSIYINPDQPPLAIQFNLGEQQILSGTLHLCQRTFLHYSSEGIDDRIPVRQQPSIRTQASNIVRHILAEWSPAKVLIGTGNPDRPEIASGLELPSCWEARTR